MTQWIGGLGIVFFTIAVLPIFGVGGIQVFAAEASGPTHDKVHPRIGITAKWIWGIYAGMTGTLIVLLVFGGMSVFDSICHAFTTTSTGGFSTKQASIEYYHSPYIDYVISIFMFLSGINFTLLLLMFNGKIKKFIHDAELKFYFWCVSFFTIFIAVWLHQTSSMEIEEAFRKSLFQVISLQTSTGFATADYMLWPSILWGCLVIVMIIGACAGSTTGGIKCIRMVILFQVVKTNSNIFFTLMPCSRCELTNRLFLLPSSLQYWPLLFICSHRYHQHTYHDGAGSRFSGINRNSNLKYG